MDRPHSHGIARALLPLLAGAAMACGGATEPEPRFRFTYDFEAGLEGWTAGFADYPDGWEEQMELGADHRRLPPPLDTSRWALFITGRNASDDLFMFWKREIGGLPPGTAFALRFRVTLASNAGAECAGIGGPPGTGVRLKAGATAVEPVPEGEDNRMNVDKGGQSTGGEDAVLLGHVGIPDLECSAEAPYRLKELDSRGRRFTATTDGAGRLWLLVGTESAFEGLTALYYDRIVVELFEP